MAARRGFRRMPPTFHSDEMRSRPAGHFFDTITRGFGAMSPYANAIPIRDRWAIVAYIRSLQLSQFATVDNVPPDQRSKLESSKQ
jgi:hypothetical protein